MTEQITEDQRIYKTLAESVDPIIHKPMVRTDTLPFNTLDTPTSTIKEE